MKVLVADDDRISRAVLDTILRNLQYEPVVTENGRRALAALVREEIPLVITDWNMPEMDGLELCRRLRDPSRKVYTYVILLTVRSGKSNYLEGLAAGADDFMTKPVDPSELAARLKVGERIVGLQKEMRQMQGLLSICMLCKKIREGEEWIPVDSYIGARTATSFSHGFCPECFKKEMGE
jgi:DNA-binding response OmpR family regulator